MYTKPRRTSRLTKQPYKYVLYQPLRKLPLLAKEVEVEQKTFVAHEKERSE